MTFDEYWNSWGRQFFGKTPRGETLARDAWLAAQQAIGSASPQSDGVALIAAERQRQIEVEGWTPERDDGYTECELVDAAVCYVAGTRSWVWPWAKEWWKPSPNDHVRDLVKAGALIAAEIDRLRRKAARNRNKR